MPVDQYGKDLSKCDLAGLPTIQSLIDSFGVGEDLVKIIEVIDRLDWWETEDGWILIDANMISAEWLEEMGWDFEIFTPEEFFLPDDVLYHIPYILHRWSMEDGFYHA